MPPKRPVGDGVFRPASLSPSTRISLSIVQVFMFIGLIVSIAFAWWDLKSDFATMRREMWSLNAERASWRTFQKLNPNLPVPDVDELYRADRK